MRSVLCHFLCFRPDGNQHNLRSAAYEALMEMVKNSPKVCMQMLVSTGVNITDFVPVSSTATALHWQ